jgi:NIPSNAP
MIHALREYHCVPGRLPALLRRLASVGVALFEKHGIKPVGFWTVEIGKCNSDLLYMLQWQSMAERERKYASFLSDPDWIEARDQSEQDGPIVASITNSVLTPTEFSALK